MFCGLFEKWSPKLLDLGWGFFFFCLNKTTLLHCTIALYYIQLRQRQPQPQPPQQPNNTKATKAGNQTKAGNHTKSAPQISRTVEKYLNVSLFSLSTGNSGKSFSNIDFRNIPFGKSTTCSPKVLMWNLKLMIWWCSTAISSKKVDVFRFYNMCQLFLSLEITQLKNKIIFQTSQVWVPC